MVWGAEASGGWKRPDKTLDTYIYTGRVTENFAQFETSLTSPRVCDRPVDYS